MWANELTTGLLECVIVSRKIDWTLLLLLLRKKYTDRQHDEFNLESLLRHFSNLLQKKGPALSVCFFRLIKIYGLSVRLSHDVDDDDKSEAKSRSSGKTHLPMGKVAKSNKKDSHNTLSLNILLFRIPRSPLCLCCSTYRYNRGVTNA